MHIVLSVLLLISFCFSAEILTVSVHESPPCVIKNGNSYTGFDIELWEAIASDLGLKYQYNDVDTFSNIFPLLTNGLTDIAIAGITIKEDRERIIDFSHSYLSTGLGILILNNPKTSFLHTLKSFFSPSIIKAILILIAFIILSAHLVWREERGSPAFDDKYFPGIFEGIWWAVVTMSTVGYGDKVPEKWISKITAVLVIFIGISIFGFVIAEFSSAVTIQKLQSGITCKDDLNGKRVATVGGTTSIEPLRNIGANIVVTKKIDDAYKLLLAKECEAIVFDAPMLMYFAKTGGKGKVSLVGEIFEKQDYGIAMTQMSPLRESINISILKFRQNGTYDKIYEKWFGKQ